MPVCFPMRDKKSVNSLERGSREDLGGVGKKTIIRLYYIKKLDFFFFFKKKTLKGIEFLYMKGFISELIDLSHRKETWVCIWKVVFLL